MQPLARILAVSLAAALASFVVAAGPAAPGARAGDPCYHGFDMPALTVGPGSDVRLMPCAFDPAVTAIPAGGTVTFHNGPEWVHLVTGANQTWGDRDVELAPGATVSYAFEEPGVYPYACALHRGMSGAIVVGDGGDSLRTAMGAVAAGTTTGGGGGSGSGDAPAGATQPAGGSATDPAPFAVAGVALVGTLLAGGLVLAARRRGATAPEPSGR